MYNCPMTAKYAYSTAKKVWIRTKLSSEQNHKCCWCGCTTVEENGKKNSATIEHILPKSQGGTYDFENLAMACSKCNNERKTMDVDAFLAKITLRVQHNVNVGSDKKPGRIKRMLEAQLVRIAVKKSPTHNPYTPGSREWKTFNRYVAVASTYLVA